MKNAMAGLSVYPPTKGDSPLRNAIADWIARRYGIARPDPETQVLPALGSREALFAFAQTVIDPSAGSLVVCPNPFYQIYEGAALLAGAQPYFINAQASRNFGFDWASVPDDVWRKTRLLFVCSPGNPAGNVIPGEARARLNIRFNDRHSPESLTTWIEDEAAKVATQTGAEISVMPQVSGVSFLTPPGAFTALVADAVRTATGTAPQFSTSGGTSDARFIKDSCPVLELGLAGATMHKVDECVPVAEIAALTDIYAAILKAYFENPPK